MATIVTKRKLNPTVSLIEVECPPISKKAKPGQFVMVRADAKGERIPLTIADYDEKKGTVTIMYQTVGLTTQKLDALKEGEDLLDIVGPLGNPTETEGVKRAVVIGGGVGCAIAFPHRPRSGNPSISPRTCNTISTVAPLKWKRSKKPPRIAAFTKTRSIR